MQWWNPTVEEQAIDRAHRIGQTRTVNVTRITIAGEPAPPAQEPVKPGQPTHMSWAWRTTSLHWHMGPGTAQLASQQIACHVRRDPLAAGTIEDKMLALQDRKRKLIATAIGDGSASMQQANKLTQQELESLFF